MERNVLNIKIKMNNRLNSAEETKCQKGKDSQKHKNTKMTNQLKK